jgi:hypothetical protein
MLAERRPGGLVPSFASNSNHSFADKENAPLVNPHSPSRHHSVRSRRRCARTFTGIPQSQSLSTAARTQPHRARRLTPRPALFNSQLAPNNESSSPTLSTQQVLLHPRRLPRPLYRDIDPRNITVANPSLEGIPLQFIRQNLKEMGPRCVFTCFVITHSSPNSRIKTFTRDSCYSNAVQAEGPGKSSSGNNIDVRRRVY